MFPDGPYMSDVLSNTRGNLLMDEEMDGSMMNRVGKREGGDAGATTTGKQTWKSIKIKNQS